MAATKAERLVGVDVREHRAGGRSARKACFGGEEWKLDISAGKSIIVRRHDGGVDARVTYRSNS